MTSTSDRLVSSPVPRRLRSRRFVRRLPPVRAYRIVAGIWRHPANQGRRVRAVSRSVLWQVRSRVSRKPVDLQVFGDLTFRCVPRSGASSNVQYFTEYHDLAEMRALERLVRPGDTVIDAGANVGTYTLLLAKLVGPRGSVVAFEPVAKSAGLLQANVELNQLHQVRVVRAAVGSAPGRAAMTTRADVSNTLAIGPGTHEVTQVDVVRLDDVVLPPVTLLKLDVEGFELEALRGAQMLLAARPLILLELTEHLLRRAGTSTQALLDDLDRWGFRVGYLRVVDGRVVIASERTQGDDNALAVPRERWDEVHDRL